jgi:hypothetical protein
MAVASGANCLIKNRCGIVSHRRCVSFRVSKLRFLGRSAEQSPRRFSATCHTFGGKYALAPAWKASGMI